MLAGNGTRPGDRQKTCCLRPLVLHATSCCIVPSRFSRFSIFVLFAVKLPRSANAQQCRTRASGLKVAAVVSAPSAPVESRKPAATGGVRARIFSISQGFSSSSVTHLACLLIPHRFIYAVQVKHAMTLTEKILAKHSDNTRLQPGANIWTNVDKLLTHDVCGPGTFGIFEKEFGAGAQVWDPEKVIIIPDHYIFTSDPRANRNVDILR